MPSAATRPLRRRAAENRFQDPRRNRQNNIGEIVLLNMAQGYSPNLLAKYRGGVFPCPTSTALPDFDGFFINLSLRHHYFNRCSRLILTLQLNPATHGGSR